MQTVFLACLHILTQKLKYYLFLGEVTTSYGRGTRHAPNAIQQASIQLDLYDLEYGPFWQARNCNA